MLEFTVFELMRLNSIAKVLLWHPWFQFVCLPCRLTRPFPPSKDQLSDWLQKRDSHPILELSYLEVGLGSQSIHMQFGDGGVAYTLLVRDSLRCKRFFGLLTGKLRPAGNQKKNFLFLRIKMGAPFLMLNPAGRYQVMCMADGCRLLHLSPKTDGALAQNV